MARKKSARNASCAVVATETVVEQEQTTTTKRGRKKRKVVEKTVTAVVAEPISPAEPSDAAATPDIAAQTNSAPAAPDANGAAADADGTAAAPAKTKRQKKQPWPPGPLYTLDMRPPPHDGDAFRILTWNVAGLRSLLKKNPEAVRNLAEEEQADVVCLQETKLQEQHVEAAEADLGLPDWHHHWTCSTVIKGYSGTALISRKPPLSLSYGLGIEAHDKEGRIITAEFDKFYVVNVYTPNSGDGLRRLEYRTDIWDQEFAAMVQRLRQHKPVIVGGDLNCAHKEIDIHEPKRNERSAGFTQEERDSFTALYEQAGMCDMFRRQHADVVGYTYFSYRFNMREKKKGWRLDYFLVSEDLADSVHDCFHRIDVLGSDHVPLGLVVKL